MTPQTAVVSFGLGIEESADPDLDSLDDALNDPSAPVPATCSAINAFPDSAAYDRWAANISDAAVMELDPDAAFALSQQIAQSHMDT